MNKLYFFAYKSEILLKIDKKLYLKRTMIILNIYKIVIL